MTAEQAIEAANGLRPGNQFTSQRKYRWLRQADGVLRAMVISRSETQEYQYRGADLAEEDAPLDTVELLAPAPFDGMYVHYLCGQMDAALGEADRANNELTQYNSLSGGFAAFVRRSCPPRAGAAFRW